ncbi:MAG: cellulase family glycosylhydrolase [Bacteroidales bacterium]|nr:cellulase family glycosylhydrolase [Bacteroidales bacterium]
MKKPVFILIFLAMILTSFSQGFQNFVTMSGSKLMDGDKPYRFISFNVPTLNYLEDEMAFKMTNPYALPDEFEMRDVFKTVREMGGQVIRIYTVPVRNKNFPPGSPTYVEGPGKFNEEAFKVTDMMLSLASEYGIRIIFSLLNNHQWMGGRPNYADFRGKTADEFWTDRQLIDDFKQTINFVINRKNELNGVRYKDDKAILCWETGNELLCPVEWTNEICRYIKSLDRNHLVMDGYFASGRRTVRKESVLESSVDILSSHHYEENPLEMLNNIRKNLDVIKGRKPYVIGEFGFISTSGVESVLDSVIANNHISGALIWSLRHHRRYGGFYWHSEPLGGGIYKAYHWPGFDTGEKYDEKTLLSVYREKAFEIQNMDMPDISVPEPPVLLPIENVWSISWQGSMGASGYHIGRSETGDGSWKLAGYNISDAETPYFPLFHDKSAIPGKTYYYRVMAVNGSGISKESNIVGPVEVKRQALIDDMKNTGTLFSGKNIVPVTGDDRSFKEAIRRISGSDGSEIIYRIPGKLERFLVFSFEETNESSLDISVSKDGEIWEEIPVVTDQYVNAEKNYDYWKPKVYSSDGAKDACYIKIAFKGVSQIARVEIIYNPQ